MTKLKLLSAAAILSATIASPVLAQEAAIDREPVSPLRATTIRAIRTIQATGISEAIAMMVCALRCGRRRVDGA